jgi:hypothetical protein
MDRVRVNAIEVMETAFRRLEGQVPPPTPKPWKDGFVLRYAEQSIPQALIQKLARVISGLHAANLLVENGFVQEQAVIHRTLDELNEDIMFLVAAITNDTVTELHQRYLDAFYAEEFDDPEDVVNSTQKRDIVPRRRVQAYLTHVLGPRVNPSRDLDVSETLHKAYSGFVHASSPHIMDLCGGEPPRFHIRGMLGTPRVQEHRQDTWNYFYRSFLSVIAVAKAFGDADLVDKLYSAVGEFETGSGTNYSGRAGSES